MMVRAPRLKHHPRIDGVLTEPAWEDVAPLTAFYQCIWKRRGRPAEGKTVVYVGYLEDRLYVGVKGYEPSTEDLAAFFTQRDTEVWNDDCVEIFLDTNLDHQTYYQIIVNSLGTITDVYFDGEKRFGDRAWNGNFRAAGRVEEEFWTAEVEIPAGELHDEAIHRGTVWGFNVARNRVAHGEEYGQWVPTFGIALRPERFGFLVLE